MRRQPRRARRRRWSSTFRAWHGRVPVELLGRTPFPPIGDLPYLLTLPPYGFFWFVLAEEHALPSWHAPAPVAMPELVTFVLRDGLHTAFGDQDRVTFEKQVLPAYLPLRRWYQGKGSRLTEARVTGVATHEDIRGRDAADRDRDGPRQHRPLLRPARRGVRGPGTHVAAVGAAGAGARASRPARRAS